MKTIPSILPLGALAVAGLLTLAPTTEAKEKKYTYRLVAIKTHPGPLPAYKRVQALNWTKAPTRTSDVDRWSGESPNRKERLAVKYDEQGIPAAIGWWTRPRYIESQNLFTMEVYASPLAKGSVFRVMAYGGYGYAPRRSEPLGRKGPRLARAMINNGRGAADTVSFRMGQQGLWPQKVEIFVRVSNGSMVGADVMAYHFERQER